MSVTLIKVESIDQFTTCQETLFCFPNRGYFRPAALLERNFPSRDLTTFDGWLDNSAVMIMFRVFVDSREADL